MKLLYITHHTRTRSFSRIGNLASQIIKRGHEVTLLCISDAARLGMQEHFIDGIRYIEMPDLLPGRLRSGWCPWNSANRWLWLRKNFNFDLVHTFETRPAAIHPLQLVMRKNPAPLVIDWIDWWGRGGIITTNRPQWYQVLFGAFETFYEEHFRTLADATTVICTALAHRAEGLGVHPDSIFRIPIGADTENIPFVKPTTYRSEFDLDPEAKIAVFSAMDAVMDVNLVFEAAKKVRAACPDFKLVMTGNGANHLTRSAQQKGIGDFFIHLGRLPQDAFVKALTCADVFLLPFADKIYNRGRWPCKIGDYLSAGRPIVSNPVGEVREIMQKHSVGVLADFNPDAFSEGILQVLNNPEQSKKMGATARKVAETDLAWDGIIDELERSYEYALQSFEEGGIRSG